MKLFFTLFVATLVALVSGLAIDSDLANAKREIEAIAAGTNLDLFTVPEDNKLVVTIDGSVQGSLVLTDDDDVKIFDAEGNEVNLDDISEEDENESNEKRWIPVALRALRKLAPIIKKYGGRALKFFKCVGLDARVIGCAQHFSHCMGMGRPPWSCTGAITCLGKVGKDCAKKYK